MVRTTGFLIHFLLIAALTGCLAAPTQSVEPPQTTAPPPTPALPTAAPPPSTPAAQQPVGLVGTWKLVALENLLVDGAAVPLAQSEFAEVEQQLAAGLQAEYQFDEEDTVFWRLAYEGDGEQRHESSSGHYELSADGQRVTLRMPRHWITGALAGIPSDVRIITLELNVHRQDNRLTLQYASEADGFSIDLRFEKVG
jgi:hypothetical protein